MTDYTELKRLAEAAQAEEARLIKLAASGHGWEALPAQASFRCVASPEVVLALIAELKKVDQDRKACWAEFKVQGRQLDELKAENEALTEKYEAARDRKNSITALKTENEQLKDDLVVFKGGISALGEASKKLTFCARTTGGTAGPDQGLMDACDEVEKSLSLVGVSRAIDYIEGLRAENAGLKTGYQAYERVNAELKAEVEGLRKDRTDWQAECLKRGFEYVRESDDHYVLADVPEMADLLGALLGVEVRSKENDAYEEANSRLNEQIEGLINTIHAQESMRMSAELLEPVTGDQLPAIGSEVLIHLASCDSWVKHTVAGYYAWGDLHGDESLHRLFVRVRDADGYLNARLLKDVRIDAAMGKGEQS